MTGLRSASGDRPIIHGFDLCDELIGRRSFVEVAYLDILGELPDVAVARMLDAMLVTLVEHGLTPSAIAARLTSLGEPSSLQGAVASGLLGAGERYLGTIEQVGELFRDAAQGEADDAEIATAVVDRAGADGRRLPGFGHPIHQGGDARAEVLIELAEELGLSGRHVVLGRAIGRELCRSVGRVVPLNAAGAIGAILLDIGLPPRFGRAIAIIARSAGLVAHVMEEDTDPIGPSIWNHARTL